MIRHLTLLAILTITCLPASADEAFDAVNKLQVGMPLPQVRSILLGGGWAPDPEMPVSNKDGCEDQAKICGDYPETSSCWIEGPDWFCALSYVDADPFGSVLTVRMRVDSKAGPVYVGYDEMAKGGFG